jgi:hypothetical protein
MAKTKYALVLSGGGFKGAFQLGALNYMKEHWASKNNFILILLRVYRLVR